MKRCSYCLMPESSPHVKFNEHGVCLACERKFESHKIDRGIRILELEELCGKHRRNNGQYDCIIPVSGGKDSFFQVYWIKEHCNMNPLLVSVTDEWTHTEAGTNNITRLCKAFRCDLITCRLNPEMVRETTKWGFENLGSTNWAIDQAIYAWPLRVALNSGIKLVVYGENVPWEYGYDFGEDTYSARDQINNSVVNQNWPPISTFEKGMLYYPYPSELDKIEPIYLSYFTGWDAMRNLDIAEKYGFERLNKEEWPRGGSFDDYWQIDSIGYYMNYYLKFAKYGASKATDIASHLIRCGHISRGDGRRLVIDNDGHLDNMTLTDFLRFTRYSDSEYWEIMDKWFNNELFYQRNGRDWINNGWTLNAESKL